jgi:hypothetical protein
MKRMSAAGVLAAMLLATSACASGGANNAALTSHLAALSSQSIHIGQTRTFSHLRSGDNVGCLGRADSVSLNVPRPSVGRTTQVLRDKRLALTLVSEAHGRNIAHCTARHP